MKKINIWLLDLTHTTQKISAAKLTLNFMKRKIEECDELKREIND